MLVAGRGVPDHHYTVPRSPDVLPVDVIDGADDRDYLFSIGPALGFWLAGGSTGVGEPRLRRLLVVRRRRVGDGALFLTNRRIITAAPACFLPAPSRRTTLRAAPSRAGSENPPRSTLSDPARAASGAVPPRAGSNADFAIVTLGSQSPARRRSMADDVPVRPGDSLIVITAHPARMDRPRRQQRAGCAGWRRARAVSHGGDVLLPDRLRRDRLLLRRNASCAGRRPAGFPRRHHRCRPVEDPNIAARPVANAPAAFNRAQHDAAILAPAVSWRTEARGGERRLSPPPSCSAYRSP